MLAVAFVGQGIDALRSPKPAADAARPALEGLQKLPDPVGSSVPKNAETFAKVTAAVQIIGGALLATGRVPRVASAALAATVIPANLGARMFWNEADPERKAAKRRELLTDISLLGGLIIASADTAGKPSLGWRGRQAAARLTDTVTSALPAGLVGADPDLAERVGARLQDGFTVGAERGRERPEQEAGAGHVGADQGAADQHAARLGVGGGQGAHGVARRGVSEWPARCRARPHVPYPATGCGSASGHADEPSAPRRK